MLMLHLIDAVSILSISEVSTQYDAGEIVIYHRLYHVFRIRRHCCPLMKLRYCRVLFVILVLSVLFTCFDNASRRCWMASTARQLFCYRLFYRCRCYWFFSYGYCCWSLCCWQSRDNLRAETGCVHLAKLLSLWQICHSSPADDSQYEVIHFYRQSFYISDIK